MFKASAYLTENFGDEKTKSSRNPAETAFNLAFRTDKFYFPWLEGPGNEARFRRFGEAMKGSANWESPQAIIKGASHPREGNKLTIRVAFDWGALPEGATVVDVGGGIGKSGRAIVESHPSVKVVVQDLPEVIEDAKKVSISYNQHDLPYANTL